MKGAQKSAAGNINNTTDTQTSEELGKKGKVYNAGKDLGKLLGVRFMCKHTLGSF